jgi:LysR family transcriptional regulator, regulator of abg operon
MGVNFELAGRSMVSVRPNPEDRARQTARNAAAKNAAAKNAAAKPVLDLPQIKLSYIETFVAVAEFGSVRGAGRAMGLSSVAVLKAIRGLEHAVGRELFHRSASGTRLTLAGSELLPRSKLILDEVQQLAVDAGGLQRTSVSFGVTPMAICFLLGTALQRFRDAYPDAQLRLIDGLLTNVIPRLRDGSLDFAFVAASARSLGEDLRFEPSFNAANAFFAREGHPLIDRRCTLDEVLRYTWIQNEAYSGIYGGVIDWLTAQKRPPPRTIFCESLATSIAVVSETDAVAAAPRPLLKHSMLKGLREVRVDVELPRATFGFLSYGNTILSKPAIAMQRFIRDAAAALPSVIHL